jgi:hypothetical protein
MMYIKGELLHHHTMQQSLHCLFQGTKSMLILKVPEFSTQISPPGAALICNHGI